MVKGIRGDDLLVRRYDCYANEMWRCWSREVVFSYGETSLDVKDDVDVYGVIVRDLVDRLPQSIRNGIVLPVLR
jgi:hypothetical protein